MPRPTPLAVRNTIVTLKQRSYTHAEISTHTGVSLSTVKTILRRYRQRGEAGLATDYARCGPTQPRSEALTVRQYLAMRRWHAKWGYDKISSLMAAKYPERKLPNRRTVYRWWRKAGLITPRSRPPSTPGSWARSLHQVWQIDAKEMMRIDGPQRHCWLNIVDEYSGTVIDPPVFSPRQDL